MRLVGESPARGDRVDGPVTLRRIGQIPVAAFEPQFPDPPGHRHPAAREQLVQVTDGDVVCFRDRARRKTRIAKVFLDETVQAI